MHELHWLSVKQRVHFKVLFIAFKAIHRLVSLNSQDRYNLRSSGGIVLATPTIKTKVALGNEHFQVAAPQLWNALPRELREISDTNILSAI